MIPKFENQLALQYDLATQTSLFSLHNHIESNTLTDSINCSDINGKTSIFIGAQEPAL
jgi:hypothetical protein